MGYVIAQGPCTGCKRIFAYNPVLVPSVRVNGVREPICPYCVVAFNVVRAKAGLPLIEPLPGAYDPMDERELPDE